MRIQPRFHRGKTALVLAGGGLTGSVYEIGALRAIDDLLTNRTVNDFDIYVGTSAGSLVSTLLANGMTPKSMLQVINGTHPFIQPLQRNHLFNFNMGEIWRRGAALPRKLLQAGSHYLRHSGDMTFFDFVWSLGEALPSGFYDNLSLEQYLRHSLHQAGFSNHFADLEKELYIIATDLDAGERAVFGCGHMSDVPISLAVAASSAVPLVYKPVRIGDREYIDGGMRGTASIDLAIERGAELVLCINPLVPYDNSRRDAIPFLGHDGGYLSEKGVQGVGNQVLRIMMHSGLNYHVKQVRRMHPEVDIILIEPRMDDYQMHFYNIMRYSAQLTIAQHGFESVTLDLAEDYQGYKDILSRHGISISRRLVIEELTEIWQSGYNPQVVRRVLSSRAAYYERRDTPLHKLNETLADLELMLEEA
ncbi:MAG: patatin-like phospholipase family protein [Ardenticatenaceae bacterium]|nr:patatin-like phospholipase family protein [Anaerolineales bacterium]MCB8920205.1 patatin-like phospholipase family protein [Ardenticatenaceae bacterium]MCB9004878.1 patatin-like phospholipase family protein [Ardenticatenaceae bacterium]